MCMLLTCITHSSVCSNQEFHDATHCVTFSSNGCISQQQDLLLTLCVRTALHSILHDFTLQKRGICACCQAFKLELPETKTKLTRRHCLVHQTSPKGALVPSTDGHVAPKSHDRCQLMWLISSVDTAKGAASTSRLCVTPNANLFVLMLLLLEKQTTTKHLEHAHIFGDGSNNFLTRVPCWQQCLHSHKEDVHSIQ